MCQLAVACSAGDARYDCLDGWGVCREQKKLFYLFQALSWYLIKFILRCRGHLEPSCCLPYAFLMDGFYSFFLEENWIILL